MTGTIDLNADVGEGMAHDEELLAIVTSASIACGGHAGDAQSIRRALLICMERGVRAGAHPGYNDRANFGRVRREMPVTVLQADIRAQLTLIGGIAGELGVPLGHLKLHGALANMAAEDLALAIAVFEAARALDAGTAVLALDNSMQVRAAETLGLGVIREAYADRAYMPDGLLVPRGVPGAVLADPDAVVAQCLRLARDGEIVAIDGTVLKSGARSICLHSDTPGAAGLARAIRDALEAEGVRVAAW